MPITPEQAEKVLEEIIKERDDWRLAALLFAGCLLTLALGLVVFL